MSYSSYNKPQPFTDLIILFIAFLLIILGSFGFYIAFNKNVGDFNELDTLHLIVDYIQFGSMILFGLLLLIFVKLSEISRK